IHLDTCLSNHMTQKGYSLEPELAFGEFCKQIFSSEGFYNHSQMLLVLLLALRVDKNIVNKDNNELIEVGMEDTVHEVHENSWRIAETERHDDELVMAVTSPESESHMKTVKHIIKYVAGTSDYGLFYSVVTNLHLAGYCDADWAGNLNDKKSTSGGCFYIGPNLVSWFCKKQNFISLSTAETGYIAAGSCCSQLIWMKQILSEYGIKVQSAQLFSGNTSAINISKNPIQHSRTKHIYIHYHFIRNLVEDGII
ncbi:cysteine-rich RLK (RECEPTOR-like protein kinase) 8, partial [Striga hermonthica]